MKLTFIQRDHSSLAERTSSSSWPIKTLGYLGDSLLKNRIFQIISLGHLHTLVHELGHAISYEFLSGHEATIELCTQSCYGFCLLDEEKIPFKWQKSYVSLAGPLANLIFSVVLLVGVFAITRNVSMSNEWNLGLNIAIGGPAGIWIFGELFHAAVSVMKKKGDFGDIASRSWIHLVISTAILLSVLILGGIGMYYIQLGYGA